MTALVSSCSDMTCMTLQRGSCILLFFSPPTTICPSMSVLDSRSLLHSCSSGPESWYLTAESRAVRVRPLSGPGRPYRDSAQVVICIQSMQTFSLTLSPKLLHDSPTKLNRMIAVPLCLFRNLSGFVGRHMTKVMIHLETFLKHSLLIHKVAARSLVLSCESSCAA